MEVEEEGILVISRVVARWNRRESLILKQFVLLVSFFERPPNSVSNSVRCSYLVQG
jgi:hypothetical protein